MLNEFVTNPEILVNYLHYESQICYLLMSDFQIIQFLNSVTG